MTARIDGKPRPHVGSPQKLESASNTGRSPVENSVAERARQGGVVDAFQGARLSERSLASLGNPVALAKQAEARPVLTPAEEAEARRAIEEATGSENPESIAEWLRAHPDPAEQAAFMDMLFEYGPTVGNILENTDDLSPEDQKMFSEALDAAYRRGAVTLEELQAAVGSYGNGTWSGESHSMLAKIVAGTGNPDLINAYVERELEIMKADGMEDPARAVAIATALASLPPDELQKFLERNPDVIPLVLQNLEDPSASLGAGAYEAVGKLLDAANAIQPPTPQSIQVFMDSIQHLGENEDSRAAAARFFTRNADAILSAVSDASGAISSRSAGKLAEFFTRTLFTEPTFEGQEALQRFVGQKLGEMQKALEAEADTNPPTQEAQRLARRMGSLVGAIEGGFMLAVEELDKRNEATEGLVGLLFKVKDLLPDVKIPVLGSLRDLTLDQIQDWVTESLKEHPDDPKDAIPFHVLFGEAVSNPTLATIYETARGTARDNRELGLDD
ncbi:hypothetical protein LXT21_16390 [Myxococcus sp. K38C18041901]|uniref:hypothetical protein n=1 Tax=Myxococcus guangdongensis TaxID=2906760 RepID=UPI0020A827C4|nr:hypothetical protein [Myxococcus guangdongensis]MCP3060361.1 hypothetical protein [Myxococcus guangdongensis]